jgi:hypothetical protein
MWPTAKTATMANPKSHKRTRGGKASSAGRAAPTTDWLGFIRPHFEVYRMLPWGKQNEFIDKLARDIGPSANTLRRYIAAAELLEGFGITQFPPDLTRMPVASVEAIGRISRKDPVRGRTLLTNLLNGSGTIRGLRKELAAMPKRATAASRSAGMAAPVSQAEFYVDVKDLLAAVPHGRDWMPPKLEWRPFNEWTGPTTILAKQAWPRIIVPLVGGHAVVAFDETVLVWAASPAMVTREFTRNVAVAVTMFDFVLVYCNALQPDVERIVAAMREDCRSRILVWQGTLGFL